MEPLEGHILQVTKKRPHPICLEHSVTGSSFCTLRLKPIGQVAIPEGGGAAQAGLRDSKEQEPMFEVYLGSVGVSFWCNHKKSN